MSKRRYTADEGRRFCARLAEGESITFICSDPAMPGEADILDWLCARAKFRDRYARARELRSHVLLEEILAIADGKDQGNAAGAGETTQDAKQRIEARKWVVERLAPKTSGEKSTANKPSRSGRPVMVRVITGVPRAARSGSSDEGDRSRLRGPRRLREIPRED